MPINRIIAVLVALVALSTTVLVRQPAGAQAAAESPAAVIAWNEIALRTVVQVDRQTPVHSIISMAYVQAAVYDAVVAIEGGYEPYQVRLAQLPEASVDAAVATAAHHVLLHYFPDQQAALDADYAGALAALADGVPKQAGIAVGQAAAAGLIARRLGDGYEAEIDFTMPAPASGVWQLPEGQAPLTPWVARVRPFLLRSTDQFESGPPTPLTSRAWARDFTEVKSMGGVDSTSRTAEQTDVARFWSTQPIPQYNAVFKQLVLRDQLSSVQAARLFAMGNLVGADAEIACFDAKYRYMFWRPQFAIPQGDSDGNAATIGDPTWKPLLATPAHPDYPSSHACLTGAVAEVLATFLGTERINIDVTSPVPNLLHPTRHFDRADDLTEELMNARVWGGIHFRDATLEGAKLGRKVTHWTLKRYFRPED
jgi:hypothetical protein